MVTRGRGSPSCGSRSQSSNGTNSPRGSAAQKLVEVLDEVAVEGKHRKRLYLGPCGGAGRSSAAVDPISRSDKVNPGFEKSSNARQLLAT